MELLEKYKELGSKTDKEWGHKYISYFYNDRLMPFKNKQIKVLEIGVQHGYSIDLWNSFFTNATIVGVDQEIVYNSEKSKNIFLHEMNAYSDETIDFLFNEYGKFDIIIDDGPHTYESQDYFLKKYDKILNDQGLIVVEDVPLNSIDSLLKDNPTYFKIETNKAEMNYDNHPGFNAYNDSAIIFKILDL